MADDGNKKLRVKTNEHPPGARPHSLSVFEAQFLSKYLANNGDGRLAIEQMSGLRGAKANFRANEILKRPIVRYHLEEQLEAQAARHLLTADRALQEVMRLAFYNIRDAYDKDGDLIPVNKLPIALAAALEGFETEEYLEPGVRGRKRVTKYKFAKKQGPLQMLAEHLRLVVQKFEVTGANGAPLNASRVDLSDVSTALLEKIVMQGEAQNSVEVTPESDAKPEAQS